jgi:hypothetical protein
MPYAMTGHARKLIWKTRLIKVRLRNNDQEVNYEAGGVSKAPLEIIPLPMSHSPSLSYQNLVDFKFSIKYYAQVSISN